MRFSKACNNFVRYSMAGIGSLVSADLGRALMPGILYTLCGVIMLLFSGCITYVRIKGVQKANQDK